MAGSAALLCRMHDPEQPGVFTDHRLWWKGPEGVVQRVEAPLRIRPGRSVRLPTITLARNAGAIQLKWESEHVTCEWRPPAQHSTEDEKTAVLIAKPDESTSWDADFRVDKQAMSEPYDVYPRLHVGRVSPAAWFVAVAHAVSIGGAILGAVGLVWMVFASCAPALLMLVGGAVIAALANPFVLRLFGPKIGTYLPSQTEHLGTISIPRIAIEPAISHSTIVSSPIVRAYCESVARHVTDLHVLGISVPVSAEAGYIPIALRVGRITRVPSSVPKEAYTEIDRMINRDMRLRNLLDGTRHSLEEAWQLHRHLTVVGDVGSGKTTALRRLSHRLALGAVHWTVSVPVYLELHRVARRSELGTDPVGTLRTAIIDRIVEMLERSRSDDDPDPRPTLRDDVTQIADQLIENGELTLLLDGLDEVSDGDPKDGQTSVDSVISMIRETSKAWDKVRFVVACRQSSAERYRSLPEQFVIAEMMMFDEEAIEKFIQQHFVEHPERASRLLDEIRRNSRLRGLASTPLFLTLITLLFEQRGSLPKRRSEIYRTCVAMLLLEWDEQRGQERRSAFSIEGKEEFLRYLAWDLHSKGARFVSRDEITIYIAAFLPNAGLTGEDPARILDEIAAHHGILRLYDNNWFGFVHFAFQEYYAAECVKPGVSLEYAINNRHRAWWQEVLRLYAGRDDTASLITALLHEREDVFRTNLILAGDCLGECDEIDPELRDTVVDALVDATETVGVPELDRRIWQTLARIGGSKAQNYMWRAIVSQSLRLDIRLGIISEMTRWSPNEYLAAAYERVRDRMLGIPIRTALVELIGASGERKGYETLLRILNDSDMADEIRGAAAGILATPENQDIVDVFETILFDQRTPTDVRRAVAKGLHLHGKQSIFDRMIDTLNNWHVDVSYRTSLANVAGELVDGSSIHALVEVIENPRVAASVRTALAVSLKGRNLHASGPNLIELVGDRSTDYSVRLAVADILSSVVTASHRDALSRLCADGGLEDPIRRRVALALAAVGDERMTDTLVRIIEDGSARSYLRIEAARILGTLDSPNIVKRMLNLIDSRAIDPFGQELAVLVLELRGDASVAHGLVDRLSDRSLPLSARLRMVNTLGTLETRSVVGRLVALLADRAYTADLRGRIALTLTHLTDARDRRSFNRIISILGDTKDVFEMYTLAWHLSEQLGVPVYPSDIGIGEIVYVGTGGESEANQ